MQQDDPYYCLPYFEPHALFRDFMLAHPDADLVWTTTDEGESDVLMDDRTARCFHRWHEGLQDAAMVPHRGILPWGHALEPFGWPPV